MTDDFELVQAVFERLEALVWDAEDSDDDDDALDALRPEERAIYVTRELEAELADGGWYLVFANENDYLLEREIDAYELLGLPGHAAFLRRIQATVVDDPNEDDSDRYDEEWSALGDAEPARARLIRRSGLA